MSNKKNNTAAVSVAVLKSNFEAAETALNAITETATIQDKEKAQGVFNAFEEVLNSVNTTATATPEQKQKAQSDFDKAKSELDAILLLPTLEEKELAQTAFDEAKTAYETAIAPKTSTAPKAEKEKRLKGVFILSPTGRFNLGYNVGESASLPELQALELEEAGYFKLDK